MLSRECLVLNSIVYLKVPRGWKKLNQLLWHANNDMQTCDCVELHNFKWCCDVGMIILNTNFFFLFLRTRSRSRCTFLKRPHYVFSYIVAYKWKTSIFQRDSSRPCQHHVHWDLYDSSFSSSWFSMFTSFRSPRVVV